MIAPAETWPAIHIDEAPRNVSPARLANETEDAALRLLREIRAVQDTVVAEIRETNAKLDALIAAADMKHDKRVIELTAIRGRVRRVEGTMEAMARGMSDGAGR